MGCVHNFDLIAKWWSLLKSQAPHWRRYAQKVIFLWVVVASALHNDSKPKNNSSTKNAPSWINHLCGAPPTWWSFFVYITWATCYPSPTDFFHISHDLPAPKLRIDEWELGQVSKNSLGRYIITYKSTADVSLRARSEAAAQARNRCSLQSLSELEPLPTRRC